MKKILLIIFLFNITLFSKHSGFIENTGIWDREVMFVSFDNNETIWITKKGFIVQNTFKNLKEISQLKNDNTYNIEEFNIEYEFLDCNFKDFKEIGITNNKYNFIKGNDKNKWITDCFPSEEIIFKDVKGESDIRYYFENGRFRYDILDYKDIQIAINGADKINLKNNTLEFKSKNKSMYQKDLKGIHNHLETKINLQLKDNIISFKSEYDYISGLIIDPLVYGAYIGGLGYDSGEDIKTDYEGNILITGETTSLNFPATLGAYSRTLNSKDTILKPDIFVTKLDVNNNHLFTTYIGSSESDYGRGVSFDSLNHIYITGYCSNNEDFPIVGDTYSQTHNGAFDGFVVKLNRSGNDIFFSTFIGGNRDDFPLSIETYKNGRSVITGYTTQAPDSARYPATSGVFNSVFGGNIDGFVTVLNNDGQTLVWSGVIGGLKDDFPQEVKLDKDGNVYICGLTRSPNYPTTPLVIKRQYTDNQNSALFSDGFASKISSDGQKIIFSTLIGGSNADIAYSLAIDDEKNVYVGGSTASIDYEVSTNAFSKSLNKGKSQSLAVDCFVMKMDSTAENLLYSSFLGGESNDRCYGIDVDRFGALYGTGLTNSIDYPTSYLTFDDTYNDSLIFSDMIMFKVNQKGDSLIYSSYYGGERSDLGKAIKVKFENTVLITGNTSSTYIPTTEDGIQFEYQDSLKSDAFVIEAYMEDFSNSDYVICRGNSVQIASDITSTITQLKFQWSPGSSLDDPTKEFPIATPDRSTQYQCVVTDEFNEKYLSLVLVSVIPGINSEINGSVYCDNGVEYVYFTPDNFGSKFKWLAINGTILGSDTLNTIKVVWSDADNGVIRLIENSVFGCGDTVWREIDYLSSYQLEIVPFGNYILCEGDTVVFDGGEEYSDFKWNSGSKTRYDTVYKAGIHYFTALDLSGSNYTSPQATVTLKPTPSVPNVIYNSNSNELLCLNSASGYQWYFNNRKIEGATSRKFTPVEIGCYKVEITSSNNCKNESAINCLSSLDISINSDFQVFPNPVENLLNFKSEILIEEFSIYDYFGNEIINKEIFGNEYSIDLSHLSSGIYIVKINNKDIYKLIKL